MLRWILCALLGVGLCALGGEVSADSIKKLTRRLSKSGSPKIRISAALALAKNDDPRALRALRRALRVDRASSIRRIAAASLGQSARGRRLSSSSHKAIVAALKKAAREDRSPKVRSSARVALAKASLAPASHVSQRRRKGIMVGVLAPTKVSRRLPKNTAALLQSRVKKVIAGKSPGWIHTAAGSGMFSSAELERSGLLGYSVVPSISKLTLKRQGRHVFVSCEVKMRLAPWAGAGGNLGAQKSATVTGAGTISSGSSSGAIARSSQACLDAVVTQVTAAQVVPFLVTQAR